MLKTHYIPPGFHCVTPYIVVKRAAQAIDFYKQAFGAQECYRLTSDGQSIVHAEIVIGDSIIMLTDEMPESGHESPQSLGGSAVNFTIYVPDAQAAFQRAVDAGAIVVSPLADQFYGDRAGCLEDPYGHRWSIMTHIEDVSIDEMKKRLPAELE